MNTDEQTRTQLATEQSATATDLAAEGRAIIEALESWDLTGHEKHGLRPWRTCRMCWEMSFFVFVEIPLRDRWDRFLSWLRPVVIRATREEFVTREWRWTRRAASQRELWRLADLIRPGAPWIARDIYPLFWAWDVHDGHLPDQYESS